MSTAGSHGSEADRLQRTVIDGGYCVGCGACAVGEGAPFRVAKSAVGTYTVIRREDGSASLPVLGVCPFGDDAADEDAIARELYPDATGYDRRIGRFRGCFAGHVEGGRWREVGASGGMGTWVLSELLRRGEIDAAIHVREAASGDGSGFFVEFATSRTQDDVLAGAKSRYHPVEMSSVLEAVRSQPGRYALVGVPCFVKALRLLQRRDPILRERVVFTMSLFCGHLKSIGFAQMFGWQLGVHPSRLGSCDFRVKDGARPANDYSVRVVGRDDRGEPVDRVARVKELYGSDWGLGFFKYKACDYCDDIVGETADISIGDAWINPYMKDGLGTNVIITRSELAARIVNDAIASGELRAQAIDASRVADSQAANVRHRQEGLRYRLLRRDRAGQWRPKKRAEASRLSSRRLEHIQELREEMAETSHAAFAAAVREGSFDRFRLEMEPIAERYRRARAVPAWKKYPRKWVRGVARMVLGSVRSK